MTPNIVQILTKNSIDELATALNQYSSKPKRIFELRLDFLDSLNTDNTIDIDSITKLIKDSPHQIILTLRAQQDGGQYTNDKTQRIKLLKTLAPTGADYIDIESDIAHEILDTTDFGSTRIIVSYHNFDKTPDNLAEILKSITHPKVAIYKLACQANTSIDN